jgi:RNA polymerase sigma-70 factor (ECF subfamily)
MRTDIIERIDALYRTDSRRVLATLIRLLGDFDLAEEALQDAFTAATAQWPHDGVPGNPSAWLVSTGRFKAIDRLRRRARFDAALGEIAVRLDATPDPAEADDEVLEDDRLRLIFVCCHPALSPDAQVAMTLREVCGLTTEEIAGAFLTTPPTVAQRIVRAKAKIRAAGIPYEVPEVGVLPDRLEMVLRVVYLVFREGYAPSSGKTVVRTDLADEAIRLGQLLAGLLPEPEVFGLLALMLLQDSRRAARTTEAGDVVLLPDQDRSLWDRQRITEGAAILERATSSGAIGSLCAPSRHRGRPRSGDRSRDDRLEPDRRAVSRPLEGRPITCDRAQPERGGRHARRTRRRSRPDRRHLRPW